MRVDFEVIQAVLWCITYVLIIFFNIRYRTLGIPPIAIASNFAWETVALLQDVRYAPSSFNIYDVLLGSLGNLIHTAWFFLDVLIVVTYLVFCRPVYLKCKWYWAVLHRWYRQQSGYGLRRLCCILWCNKRCYHSELDCRWYDSRRRCCWYYRQG